MGYRLDPWVQYRPGPRMSSGIPSEAEHLEPSCVSPTNPTRDLVDHARTPKAMGTLENGDHSTDDVPLRTTRLHQQAVATVATLLRHRGYSVAVVSHDGIDLLVADTLRIAVRAARRAVYVRRTTCGGRVYEYRYPGRQWNLRHGRRSHARPDAWILVTHGERDVFVVPATAFDQARAYKMLDGPTARRHNRIWEYLNRWDLVGKEVGAA